MSSCMFRDIDTNGQRSLCDVDMDNLKTLRAGHC
jgi:hypothetical protein